MEGEAGFGEFCAEDGGWVDEQAAEVGEEQEGEVVFVVGGDYGDSATVLTGEVEGAVTLPRTTVFGVVL